MNSPACKPVLPLPLETRQKLGVGPAVTSIDNVVEELVKNSIDAQASSIQVALCNDGLGMIKVQDDGIGMSEADIVQVGQRGYTSKISSYADLDNLSTFGFRGEALNAICACSSAVSITTRAANNADAAANSNKSDALGIAITLDRSGHITSKIKMPFQRGTRVSVSDPLSAFPVRQQNSMRQAQHINQKIIHMLNQLYLANPVTRFSLEFIKSPRSTTKLITNQYHIWPSADNVLTATKNLVGRDLANSLEYTDFNVEYKDTDTDNSQISSSSSIIRVEAVFPKPKYNTGYSKFLKYSGLTLIVNKQPYNSHHPTVKFLTQNVYDLYPGLASKQCLFAVVCISIDSFLVNSNQRTLEEGTLFRDESIISLVASGLMDKIKQADTRDLNTELFSSSSSSSPLLSKMKGNQEHVNISDPIIMDSRYAIIPENITPNTANITSSPPPPTKPKSKTNVWRSTMEDSDDDDENSNDSEKQPPLKHHVLNNTLPTTQPITSYDVPCYMKQTASKSPIRDSHKVVQESFPGKKKPMPKSKIERRPQNITLPKHSFQNSKTLSIPIATTATQRNKNESNLPTNKKTPTKCKSSILPTVAKKPSHHNDLISQFVVVVDCRAMSNHQSKSDPNFSDFIAHYKLLRQRSLDRPEMKTKSASDLLQEALKCPDLKMFVDNMHSNGCSKPIFGH